MTANSQQPTANSRMQEKSFISYKVDIKSIDNSKSEFASLSLNDQKRF
jgi:hypothetical protein